jgi:hypothetical protein
MRFVLALVLAGCSYAPQRTGAQPAEDASLPDDGAPPIDMPFDAPPLPACPTAPAGCTAFECRGSTSCYYECPPLAFTAARDRCVNEQRGCLATIDDADEHVCLFANTSPIVFPDLVYVGYRQAQNQTSPDDGWSWECGTSTYVAPNWGDFEPNDSDGIEDNSENCMALGVGGAWIDIDCDDDMRFVCELPRL